MIGQLKECSLLVMLERNVGTNVLSFFICIQLLTNIMSKSVSDTWDMSS